MSSTVIATVIKMLESLPEQAQEEAIEHLRGYIAELHDDRVWDARFKQTQPQLVAAARRVREDIAQGRAEPLDLNRL